MVPEALSESLPVAFGRGVGGLEGAVGDGSFIGLKGLFRLVWGGISRRWGKTAVVPALILC